MYIYLLLPKYICILNINDLYQIFGVVKGDLQIITTTVMIENNISSTKGLVLLF